MWSLLKVVIVLTYSVYCLIDLSWSEGIEFFLSLVGVFGLGTIFLSWRVQPRSISLFTQFSSLKVTIYLPILKSIGHFLELTFFLHLTPWPFLPFWPAALQGSCDNGFPHGSFPVCSPACCPWPFPPFCVLSLGNLMSFQGVASTWVWKLGVCRPYLACKVGALCVVYYCCFKCEFVANI